MPGLFVIVFFIALGLLVGGKIFAFIAEFVVTFPLWTLMVIALLVGGYFWLEDRSPDTTVSFRPKYIETTGFEVGYRGLPISGNAYYAQISNGGSRPLVELRLSCLGETRTIDFGGGISAGGSAIQPVKDSTMASGYCTPVKAKYLDAPKGVPVTVAFRPINREPAFMVTNIAPVAIRSPSVRCTYVDQKGMFREASFSLNGSAEIIGTTTLTASDMPSDMLLAWRNGDPVKGCTIDQVTIRKEDRDRFGFAS